jgi:hypothetical protein
VRLACQLETRGAGEWRVFTSSIKRQNRAPQSPKGPTAIGMNAWLDWVILQMTSSGGIVWAVIGLVPPRG